MVRMVRTKGFDSNLVFWFEPCFSGRCAVSGISEFVTGFGPEMVSFGDLRVFKDARNSREVTKLIGVHFWKLEDLMGAVD